MGMSEPEHNMSNPENADISSNDHRAENLENANTTHNAGGYEFTLSDEEWRERLHPEQYAILRQAATERAGTGELLGEWGDGVYSCGGCGNELFASGTKFESHCGWPSFYESIKPEAVELIEDRSLGMVRTEVRCARCGSHLGHVFADGYGTPTGDRYCMNSLALSFEPGDS